MPTYPFDPRTGKRLHKAGKYITPIQPMTQEEVDAQCDIVSSVADAVEGMDEDQLEAAADMLAAHDEQNGKDCRWTHVVGKPYWSIGCNGKEWGVPSTGQRPSEFWYRLCPECGMRIIEDEVTERVPDTGRVAFGAPYEGAPNRNGDILPFGSLTGKPVHDAQGNRIGTVTDVTSSAVMGPDGKPDLTAVSVQCRVEGLQRFFEKKTETKKFNIYVFGEFVESRQAESLEHLKELLKGTDLDSDLDDVVIGEETDG